MKVIWFVPPALERVRAARFASLDVEGRLTGSSDEQFAGLRDGTQDAAVTALDNVIAWNRRESGITFRILAQIEQTTSLSLLARPEIADIASLRGKRVLVDSVTNGFVVAFMALLDREGVSFDECDVIPAGGVKERLDTMLHGQSDATLLGPPFIGMAEAAGMRRLEDVDRAFPGFPGQGVVVREDRLAELRSDLVAWLSGLERARRDVLQDRDAAVADLLAAGVPAQAAASLAAAVGQTLEPDRDGIALLLSQREKLGLPGSEDRYEDLVDGTPLQQALALLPPSPTISHQQGAGR